MSSTDRREETIAEASTEGHEIIYASPVSLTLDFDNCVEPPDLEEKLKLLTQFVKPTAVSQWRSRSGFGWHVVIQLDGPLELTTRIALQAIFGSDWKREMLTLMRPLQGPTGPLEPFLIQPSLRRVVEIQREQAARDEWYAQFGLETQIDGLDGV